MLEMRMLLLNVKQPKTLIRQILLDSLVKQSIQLSSRMILKSKENPTMIQQSKTRKTNLEMSKKRNLILKKSLLRSSQIQLF